MSTDAGKPVQKLTPNTLASIQSVEAQIAGAASAAGVSALSIAEPIAREENKAEVGDYNAGGFGAIIQGFKNVIAKYGYGALLPSNATQPSDETQPILPLTNQDYVESYNAAKQAGAQNTQSIGLAGDLNRVLYPTLNDIGPAKIQISTAMDAVSYYASNKSVFTGSDPLDLIKYVNNTPQLVADLEDKSTALSTSISLQAVIAQQAGAWASDRVSNWPSLSQATQAAFVSAFSTYGQAFFDKKYAEFLDDGGIAGAYQPEFANTAGSAYFTGEEPGASNASALQGVLGNPIGANGGDASDPSLIAPGTYSNFSQIENSGQITNTSFADGSSIFELPNTEGSTTAVGFTPSGHLAFSSSQQEVRDGVFTLELSSGATTSTITSSIGAAQATESNGVFTFGSPQADPDGLVNQMNVNGSLGLSSFSVTDPKTGVTATIPLDNGSSTTLQEGRSAATNDPNEQVETTLSNGQVDDAIIGAGSAANLSNAVVTIEPDTIASVTGNANTIALAANAADQINVSGTGETLTGNSGSDLVLLDDTGTSATVNGDGFVDLLASGQTLTLNNAGASINTFNDLSGLTVNGSGDTFDQGSDVHADLYGSGDNVNLVGNSGSQIGITGQNDIVSGDDGNSLAILNGAGTSATVNGDGFVDLLDSDQTLTLNNAGALINTFNDLSGLTVHGSGDTFDQGSDVHSDLYGSGDNVNLVGNSGSQIGITGQNDIVSGDDGNSLAILDGAGTSATVNGNGFVDLLDSGQTLTLNNAGASINTLNDLSGLTVNGSGDTFDQGGNVYANLYGSGNTVNLASNTGSVIGIIGQNDLVTGNSGDNVTLDNSGTSATVADTGVITMGAADQTLMAAASGDTFLANNDNIADDASFGTGILEGVGNRLSVTADYDLNVTTFGARNTVTVAADADDVVTFTGGGNLYQTSGNQGGHANAVNLDDAGTSAEIKNNPFVYINSPDETVDLDTPDNRVYLADDVGNITIEGNYSVIYEGEDDSVDVEGASDIVSSDASDDNYGSAFDGSGVYFDDGGYVGDYGGDGGDGGDYGDDGGFDFASKAAVQSPTSNDVIAQYDEAKAGDVAAASKAEAAHLQAATALAATVTAGTPTTPQFEGARWSPQPTASSRGQAATVVTWSFADSPGTATDPFSGYIGKRYKATIEKAFRAWAAVAGVKFKQISDMAASDIRIGWGDFGTGSSGILGYTSLQSSAGSIQPGAIVRLEGPGDTALTHKTTGGGVYAGTQATLYQTALHEIGHALGLADDSDPNSVMYPVSLGSNRRLDQTDIQSLQTLYGTAADSAGINRMVQALATFGASSASGTSAIPIADATTASATLAASNAHH